MYTFFLLKKFLDPPVFKSILIFSFQETTPKTMTRIHGRSMLYFLAKTRRERKTSFLPKKLDEYKLTSFLLLCIWGKQSIEQNKNWEANPEKREKSFPVDFLYILCVHRKNTRLYFTCRYILRDDHEMSEARNPFFPLWSFLLLPPQKILTIIQQHCGWIFFSPSDLLQKIYIISPYKYIHQLIYLYPEESIMLIRCVFFVLFIRLFLPYSLFCGFLFISFLTRLVETNTKTCRTQYIVVHTKAESTRKKTIWPTKS